MVSRIAWIAARLATNIAITFMSNISCHWESGWGTIVEKFAAYLSRRSSKTKELNMAELRDQILIKAAPAKVYAAIATQAGLRHRWTADSKTEDKVGGKAEFGFDNRGTVVSVRGSTRLTVSVRLIHG
jgi:hypothetical protein